MKYSVPTTYQELELLTAFHSIAMFPVSETRYQLVNEKPDWINLLGFCTDERQLILDHSAGFLENFLIDAKRYWLSSANGLIRSGKWIQTDVHGNDHPFEAIATNFKSKPVLLVQNISDSYQELRRILQSARENVISREKIERFAYRDDLTGLYNRRGFFLNAEQKLLIARREQHPVTIACIDLDRLKLINDKYGHQAGDQVIIKAADLFKTIFRQSDLLGRIGGDEFLVMMINMDSLKAINFSTRLNQAIKVWNAANENQYQLSLSIGLACDNGKRKSLEKLVKQADVNMYQHKKSKNRIQMDVRE